jgi:hypothetical protein
MRNDQAFKKEATFKVEYNVKDFEVRLRSVRYELQPISGFPIQVRDSKTNEVSEAIYSLYI